MYHSALKKRFAALIENALREIQGHYLEDICRVYDDAQVMSEAEWAKIKAVYCVRNEWNERSYLERQKMLEL